jgi:hypothetical protein
MVNCSFNKYLKSASSNNIFKFDMHGHKNENLWINVENKNDDIIIY